MSPPLPSFLVGSKRTESTFEQIPIIDFADLDSTDAVKRRALADKIRDACVNVGFFYLANPPASLLPPKLPEETIEQQAKRFFALPEEVKRQWDIHQSENFKGYTAMYGEKTDEKAEGGGIGMRASTWGGRRWGRGGGGGGKDGGRDAGHAAVRLGLALFPLFALALDMPEDFFEDKTTKPAAILRLLHYPNQPPTSKQNGEMGIGKHTDTCFTLLWQQTGITCLQVQNMEGRWVDAVPLARWTNDVFKSTAHRALNTYLWLQRFGNFIDVCEQAIPTCVSPESPAKYPVMKAGDYVKERLEATYAHSKDK
ncbi:hypothetical protein BD626DRAFT_551301 [Schizophyllum amplum]|uniref:Non-haem dioxygenase N-terminal domain-containing protein n=1 Tax=Schizophyllum amplum TaxID=97359 RepID=A0A550BWM5_9AGAR|nr:hypothetical protein BD626DRAFT_551301 [Auriculariopsis ampla]